MKFRARAPRPYILDSRVRRTIPCIFSLAPLAEADPR